jgi:predicted transcriptional regulator
VRVSEELWGEIERIAEEESRTKTNVVVEALSRHVARTKRQRRQRSDGQVSGKE